MEGHRMSEEPSREAQRVLDLANELGYFPSWREVKTELGMGSSRTTRARNAAEPYWRGPDTPTANKRNKAAPVVIGVTPQDEPPDLEALWEAAIRASEEHIRRHEARKQQSIEFPEEPFAIALFGDTHTGAAGTAYKQLREDAEIVADTDGMYAMFGGDGTNNWLVGRLQSLQRNEIMKHDHSWMLFLDWLDILGGKLVVVVEGNHDRWTAKVANFSPIAQHLQNVLCLYDSDEILFTLSCGDLNQVWKIRHLWRGSSVFNATHGQEVSWERGDDDYDVGVGFHTHNGTLFREFVRHGKYRLAVQLGTYKVADSYGKERGFASPPSLGCGAIVYHPDGRWWPTRSLREAAEFLRFLRST